MSFFRSIIEWSIKFALRTTRAKSSIESRPLCNAVLFLLMASAGGHDPHDAGKHTLYHGAEGAELSR